MSRKEKNQKPKKHDFVSILALCMLIIAILMIIAALGFGGGFGSDGGSGDGSGNGNTDNTSISGSQEISGETPENEVSATEESETEIPPESVIYIQVTVSGSAYVMDDAETALENIIEVSKGDNIVVRISDDNAVADTMDSLISALKENNIQYIEPTAE